MYRTLIYVLPVSRSAIAEVGPAATALQSLSILPNLVGMSLYKFNIFHFLFP